MWWVFVWFQDKGDGLWPIETVRDGYPVTASLPYFLSMNNATTPPHHHHARQCFNLSNFGNRFEQELHGSYLLVEVCGERWHGGSASPRLVSYAMVAIGTVPVA